MHKKEAQPRQRERATCQFQFEEWNSNATLVEELYTCGTYLVRVLYIFDPVEKCKWCRFS